jgi:hypothetical protein
MLKILRDKNQKKEWRGRMAGVSPLYQEVYVEFYVSLPSNISREIRDNEASNSNYYATRFLLETPEKLAGAKLKISF